MGAFVSCFLEALESAHWAVWRAYSVHEMAARFNYIRAVVSPSMFPISVPIPFFRLLHAQHPRTIAVWVLVTNNLPGYICQVRLSLGISH
jgi:hypothetical protein